MKGKLWILLLIGGIACALAAGYLLSDYLMQSEEADRTLGSLRELKKQVHQEVVTTAASDEDISEQGGSLPDTDVSPSPKPKATVVQQTKSPVAAIGGVEAKVTPEPAPKQMTQPKVTPEPARKPNVMPVDLVSSRPSERVGAFASTQAGTLGVPDAGIEASSTPVATEEPTASPSPTPFVLTRDMILPEYQELYDINPELIGWLTIDDTVIDYPVMQSAHPDYYLDHDFYGNKNSNGTLVMDEHCDVYKPSQSLLIHGHNMKNGKMFKALLGYADESFGMKHLTIRFDTLVEHREYQLVAAFYSKLYDEESDEEGFRYYVNVQDVNSAAYFVNGLRSDRRYDTGVEFGINDEYIVLSTCSYHVTNGRFVVVAKRVK